MNILHITNIRNTPNGIRTVLSKLVPEQIKLGHNVALASTKQNAECSNLYVHIIQDKKYIINLIDSFSPDIVIFHSLYEKTYITTYKYLRQRNIPYIIMLHGGLSKENYKKNHLKKVFANFLFFNGFIREARSVIYLNKEEYKNSIVPKINPKYSIIPNGCTPHIDINHIVVDKIEIIYIGRINIYHKGLDVLLETLKKLHTDKMYNYIHFSFYGNDNFGGLNWLKNELNEIAEIADYKGQVFGEAKDFAYRHSNIFILTSRFEGMPMGVLEALSYGIPCLITPQTNMANIIEQYHCGWVVNLDSEKIKEAIIKAVSDYKLQRKILEDNALEAAKYFSWEKIAEDSIAAYEQIILQTL